MKKLRFAGIIAFAAIIVLSFVALSLTGCPSEPDPGSGLSTLSGTITISPNSNVTVGTELTATYTGTEAVTYQWQQGAANVGTNSTTYTPAAAGSYTVTVSAAGFHSKTSDPVVVTVPNPLTSITAEYNSSNLIFPDTTLHTLKDGLTVTATYSDNTTKTLELEDYTLGGALAEGSSVITVSYTESGITKTTTFTVTVNAAHTHIWSNWSQTTAPTCIEPGVDTRNCTADPPHSETRTGAAALGHDTGEWHVTLAATCLETGTKELRCTRDQFVLQANVTVDALGHDFSGAWTQKTPPTCTVAEVEETTCTRAGCVEKSTRTGADALGHDFGEWHVTFNATCEETGTRELRCTRDNAVLDTETINAIGHDWNEWGTPIPATETVDGFRTRVCKHNSSHTDNEFSGEYATGTDGLEFVLLDSGDNSGTYRVSKGTTGNKSAIHIPAYHRPNASSEYLPVTEISNGIDDAWNGTAFGGSANSDYNTTITSVTFAENSQLKSIGWYAFYRCSNLTEITIPASVTNIGACAFQVCGLTSVTFAEDSQLAYIGQAAFGYTVITSITISASVTSIGVETFSYCTSLKTVTFAENSHLQQIGNSAFSNCTSLTSITIPASVTTIGTYVFGACTSLSSITVDANNSSYVSEGGIVYNKAKTQIVAVPQKISGSITIPTGVTSIGDGMFYNCTNITSITIPTSVTSIGYEAFRLCNGITSIEIPAGVMAMGSGVFASWTAEQTVYIAGHASEAAADTAWPPGQYGNWRDYQNAIIKYWNGTTWE